MNTKLLRSCAALWVLGLVGMWVARALLALEPRALPFQIAASFWILGGLGYTGFGLFGLTERDCGVERKRGAAPADLSAVIRRR